MNRTVRLSILGIGLLATLVTLVQTAQARDGDIIILRDVQARSAIRSPLEPYPNPRVENPGATVRDMTVEMTDDDFANVSSGMSLRGRGIENHLVNSPLMGGNAVQPSVPRSGASHTGGGNAGAGRSISGTINQNLQRGLSPLRSLGAGN